MSQPPEDEAPPSDAPASEVPTWEDDDESVRPPRPSDQRAAAEPIDHANVLRVAIAGAIHSARVLPTLTDLCKELGQDLSRPTSGHVMISYDELLVGAERDDFHLMWLPPLVAHKALANGWATALSVPVRGGSTGYATALFTRDDSDIEDVEQLEAKRVGWVDVNSLAGYVLPRAMLTESGLNVDELFTSETLLGSHESVVAAVVAGKVDVGATYAHIDAITGDVSSKALDGTPTRILAHHGPVPADILAVGRGVDAATCDRLRRTLVTNPDAELTQVACRLLECDSFELPDPRHMRLLEELTPAAVGSGSSAS